MAVGSKWKSLWCEMVEACLRLPSFGKVDSAGILFHLMWMDMLSSGSNHFILSGGHHFFLGASFTTFRCWGETGGMAAGSKWNSAWCEVVEACLRLLLSGGGLSENPISYHVGRNAEQWWQLFSPVGWA